MVASRELPAVSSDVPCQCNTVLFFSSSLCSFHPRYLWSNSSPRILTADFVCSALPGQDRCLNLLVDSREVSGLIYLIYLSFLAYLVSIVFVCPSVRQSALSRELYILETNFSISSEPAGRLVIYLQIRYRRVNPWARSFIVEFIRVGSRRICLDCGSSSLTGEQAPVSTFYFEKSSSCVISLLTYRTSDAADTSDATDFKDGFGAASRPLLRCRRPR